MLRVPDSYEMEGIKCFPSTRFSPDVEGIARENKIATEQMSSIPVL